MDKKTILAVVIMAVTFGLLLLVVNPMLQGKAPFDLSQGSKPLPIAPSPSATPAPSPSPSSSVVPAASPAVAAPAQADAKAPAAAAPVAEAEYTIKTDVVTAVFSNKGGQLVSLRLNKHLDKDKPIEMVLQGDSGSYFFGTSFGDLGTPVSKELMAATMVDPMTIEFSYAYAAPGVQGQQIPFTFRKRFSFRPGEYMFEMKIGIENSVNAVPNLLTKGFAYTLFLGPQIGPKFHKLDTYDETRSYRVYSNGKASNQSVKPNSVKTLKDRAVWASVIGKYFSLIAIPDNTPYSISYNTNRVEGVPVTSQLSFSRPAVSGSTTEDTFRFYMGPNQTSELKRYNDKAKNSFDYSGLKIDQIKDSNPFTWLESILKWMLVMSQKAVINWGLAIILVTLIIKALFFPLTLKGSISMAKMSELQPKIQELQAKYKEKPEKLNQEMMELYKKEGANPLSGCLPMLIQIPIFFAMYSLFNTHFDLRGAAFIPGWIPDLSRPDSVFDFPTVNLIIWQFSAIRILPVIYVISQLLYGKYTQTNQPTAGQNATQMKIMLYGMPIFFFFVLYNACSGLLVYWIASNVLTIVQQVITNRIIHQRKLRRS